MSAPSRPSAMCDPMDTFHPSYLDEVDNALRGPAIQEVASHRLEAILRHGHDAAHDAAQPVGLIAGKARAELSRGIELTQPGERRNLAVARRAMLRAAAMLCAEADRIGMEMTNAD